MVDIPRPGRPVRGSKSGSPIMALFDLLGRRWSMGVLWTINVEGPSTFRVLQEKCESISPSVLNARLAELKEAGLVISGERGYEATSLGIDVYQALLPLSAVSKKWQEHLIK